MQSLVGGGGEIGRCVGIDCMSLFSSVNKLGNVQVLLYNIYELLSVRFDVEPVWLLTGSPTMKAPLSQHWLAAYSKSLFNDNLFQHNLMLIYFSTPNMLFFYYLVDAPLY